MPQRWTMSQSWSASLFLQLVVVLGTLRRVEGSGGAGGAAAFVPGGCHRYDHRRVVAARAGSVSVAPVVCLPGGSCGGPSVEGRRGTRKTVEPGEFSTRSPSRRGGTGTGAGTGTALGMVMDPNYHQFFYESIGVAIAAIFAPYFARVASAERAWEERLQRERMEAEDAGGAAMDDMDFYAQSAARSPSMYGRDGVLARREREERKRRGRGRDGGLDDDEGDVYDEGGDPDFEAEFGVKYDPYYDEPYDEEELPSDKKFVRESAFGDRIYEDGEVFFKDGDKYYRRGSKPRMKFFWKKD